MKCIIFDSSTIITLAMNGILELLDWLKPIYKGRFLIPEEVKKEVVDIPSNIKRFELEALKVKAKISKNIIEVYDSALSSQAERIMRLVNSSFYAHGSPIKVLHGGEVHALALAKALKADAFAVDERTTRVLIENPILLKELLEQKLHTPISVNKRNLNGFVDLVKDIRIIRSSELCIIANEKGLFKFNSNIPKSKILDALLWAVKLNGCSISEKEIGEIEQLAR